MMQICCKLCEFCPCALLLKILFVANSLLVMRVEQFSDFLVLLFDVMEVLFTGKEIVLVFSAVVASETKQ